MDTYKFTKEHIENLRKSLKGHHWYNNGIENIYIKGDCPEGFHLGRVLK